MAHGTATFTNCRYELNGTMYDLHGDMGVLNGIPFAQFRNPIPLDVKTESFVLENVKDQQGTPYSVPGLKGDDYGKARHFAAYCISALEKFASEVQ